MIAEGSPLGLVLSPGNELDSQRFVEVLNEIRIVKGFGRPKSRPVEVLANAALDNKEIRLYLRRRGIESNIPSNKRNQKAPGRSRSTRSDRQSYAVRGSVERFLGLKSSFRRLALKICTNECMFRGITQFSLLRHLLEKSSPVSFEMGSS